MKSINYYNNLGNKLQLSEDKNNIIKSIAVFEYALTKYPYSAILYANCSLSYRKMKQFNKSLIYAKNAAEITGYEFGYCRILENILKDIKIHNEKYTGDIKKDIEKIWKLCEKNGHIKDWRQRSSHMIKYLTAKPWWDKSFFEKETKLLEDNYDIIKKELEFLIKNDYFKTKDSENLTDEDKGWLKFRFFQKGKTFVENHKLCPNTSKIINQIKNATTNVYGQIQFSKLEPGTHIKEHCAYTNTRVRIHLGMIIPKNVKIRSGNIDNTWTEGKCIYLDDSFIHEVWHDGDQDRYIFMVDVWHPELNTIYKRYNSLNTDSEKDLYMKLLKTKTSNDIKIYKLSTKPDNKPKTGDVVKYHYRCIIPETGVEIDSSYKKNKPYEYKIDSSSVIKGINIVLKNINYGETITAIIPSELAYGETGIPGLIPKNTDLCFYINLLN
tara:strand:- start:132 stop:1448 length:1317 start_codon:yes stop_codon:yes gene_type:complete